MVQRGGEEGEATQRSTEATERWAPFLCAYCVPPSPGRLREGAKGTMRRKGRGVCKGLCSQSVTSFNLGGRGR